jgi:sulfonate transport system substrate-binding protein
MLKVTRRSLSAGIAALAALAVLPLSQAAASDFKELKIGYQKSGVAVIARQQGIIEKALEKDGVKVSWVEFTAGPPLVEALNVGSVHIGWTGDAPPIFGQSAGANITYLARLPSTGLGEGVITHADSDIKSLADLKGKKVAFGKGTSANNVIVAAVEKAGLQFSDIEPVYLSPADAAAAFAAKKVDAWAIWDPYLAIAEIRHKPTVLAKSGEVVNVSSYFIGNKDFANQNPDAVKLVVDSLAEAGRWAEANVDKVAAALHEVTGVPLEAQTLAASRAKFEIHPIDEATIATQQATADRFFRLGLIPKQINVAEAVWQAPTN